MEDKIKRSKGLYCNSRRWVEVLKYLSSSTLAKDALAWFFPWKIFKRRGRTTPTQSGLGLAWLLSVKINPIMFIHPLGISHRRMFHPSLASLLGCSWWRASGGAHGSCYMPCIHAWAGGWMDDVYAMYGWMVCVSMHRHVDECMLCMSGCMYALLLYAMDGWMDGW